MMTEDEHELSAENVRLKAELDRERGLRLHLIEWVKSRIEAEVTHRPDVNMYKRVLRQTWEQMLRYLESLGDNYGREQAGKVKE